MTFVTFSIRCAAEDLGPFETVSVVGSVAELGMWDPSKGTELAIATLDGAVSHWRGSAVLPEGTQFDFKFVKHRVDGYCFFESFARRGALAAQQQEVTLDCGEFGIESEPLLVATPAPKSMLAKASDAAASTKDAVFSTVLAAKNKVIGAADYVRDGASHTLHSVAAAIEPVHAPMEPLTLE